MSDFEPGEGQFYVPLPPDDEEKGRAPPPEGLSRDTFIAILIGLAGIGGIVFTLDWISRSLLVLIAIGLTVYAALRHSARPTLKAISAVVVIALFIGFSWSPIWDDFNSKHPSIFVGWITPARPKPYLPPTPPQPPPPEVPRTTSTNARAIYKCTRVDVTDPKIIAKNKADLKHKLAVYADTFGLSINVLDVLGGIKIEIIPATSAGQQSLGSLTKITYEIRKIGKELLGIYTGEFVPGLAQMLSSLSLESGSENEKSIRQNIEGFAEVKMGDCKLQ
jgi:hypothetical protein